MKKTFIIVGLFFLAILVVALFSVLFVAKNKKNGPEAPFTVSVQPNTSPTGSANLLTVVNSAPLDKAINVPVNTSLTINFNKSFGSSDISFTIDPKVPFSADIQGKTLIITFQAAPAPGMTYTYRIDYLTQNKFPHTYSFTTTGPTRTYLPDTRPQELITEEKDFQKANHPDIYLANMMPYFGANYSISAEYTSQPTGHFFFTVTPKGITSQQAKKEVDQWFITKGLTSTQIQSLDIRYQ